MSKPLLLSLGQGKVQELVGGTEGYVPVWNATTSEWEAAPSPGGGGGGVTSLGLTGGTSGIVIGGATSPVTSTGTYELNAPLKFSWNTATPSAVVAAGDTAWNVDTGTLDLLFGLGTVTSSVGQTVHQRVKNATGSTISKGAVVYVSGASGDRPTIALALADSDSTSATILGIVAADIADGAEGYVITEGLIKGLNTNSFLAGDVLYLSPTTPGAITKTKPSAPQHLVMIGYCIKVSSSAGEVLVKTQNGYELDELHDVYISSPTSGQILIYDATAGQTRWENASPTGSSGVVVTLGAGSLAFSLDPTYAPTFLGLALSGLSASQFVKTDASKNLVSSQFVSLTSEVSGTLPVGNGGTGVVSPTAGRLLVGAGASAMTLLAGSSTDDVVKWNGSAWVAGSVPAVTSVALAVGTTGLTVSGGSSQTITSTGTFTLGGTLAVAHGGTGRSYAGETGVVKVLGGAFLTAAAISNGDIASNAEIARSKLATGTACVLLANNTTTGAMTEIAGVGSSGQVLTSNGDGALPTFQSMPAVPYDLSGDAYGSLSSGQTIFRFIAPRSFTMSAITAGGGATASVKALVAGSDAAYPQSVTTGQLVTVETTSSGTDAYFTITATVA